MLKYGRPSEWWSLSEGAARPIRLEAGAFRPVRVHPGQSQLGSVPFFRQTPRFTGRIFRLSEKEASVMPVLLLLIDIFARLLRLNRAC